MSIKAPIAKKINKGLKTNDNTRNDPYFWMSERDNADAIKYLNDENAFTKSVLKNTEKLQEDLFEEITSKIKKDDSSVPYKLGGYYYFVKYEGEKEHPIFCRKHNLDAEDQIILDVNKFAKGKSYYEAGGLSISTNDQILAFGEDTLSRRIYTIRFVDLTTGKLLTDKIKGVSEKAVWAKDNKTVFYVKKDKQTLREFQVYKHVLGTPQKEDKLVFEENDELFSVGIGKLKSKKEIVIHSSSTTTDEYRLLSADKPNEDFRLFLPREAGHEYSLEHAAGYYYILTNKNALNFKLMRCNESDNSLINWVDVVPHRDNVLIEDIEIFEKFLVVDEKENGLNRLRIMSADGSSDQFLNIEEETYSIYVGTNFGYETDILRYGYNSMTTPASVIDYNMITGEKTLLKQEEILGGHVPSNYITERIWGTSHDGEKIPMSLVYKKGFKKDGNAPVLLYGYGSYGHTIDPSFSISRLSLLNRGFAFAIAHVRGSEYLGRNWYEEGKMLNKKNTFYDFIACGEKLVEDGFTNPKQLYAYGGSAGGLLIGAVVNMKPDLFNGVIAAVPFVDVLTTMLDESIPLTVGEYEEWGNPNETKYYNYMKSYSPYDQVVAQDYPNILVTAGYHDSQVQYWEPAKWVARLRNLKTDTNQLLLFTNMEFGHSGSSGRFESLKEVALEYAFLLQLEGIEK
jgi:oligopeptidase B|tara:strand:+ start:53364 stop:55409 length:2046 start_codon:yes stop_codon:yes gene_type:complete